MKDMLKHAKIFKQMYIRKNLTVNSDQFNNKNSVPSAFKFQPHKTMAD